MTDPRVHARPRAHAARPHRQAARRDDRGRRRHARAVQPGERVVRDRRPGARLRSHARRRGGGRWPWSTAATRRRTSTPSSPRARPPTSRTTICTRRSRSRRPTGAAELVAELPGGQLAIDDAPFPLWEALRERERDRRRRRARAGQAHEDPRRARVHPPGAGDQRTGDAHRARRRRARRARRPTSPARSCARSPSSGATSNTVDPVFQVMPRSIADGPFSVTGEPVFPLPTRDRRARSRRRAVDRHRHQPQRLRLRLRRDVDRRRRARRRTRALSSHEWRSIVDRVLEVTQARRDRRRPRTRPQRERTGRRPWLSYFYLAHGIGTDSAEMPLIGTDRGDAFDASIVLATGHGARVRAGGVGRRPLRPSQRGDRRDHRRRLRVALEPGRARRRSALVTPELDYCLDRDGAARDRRAGARPRGATRARCRAPTGSGSRERARSRRAASSCAARRPCTCSPTATTASTAFPREHLYGVTWNPAKLLGALARDPRAHRREAPSASTACRPACARCFARSFPRPSSSTPARSSPSCGAFRSPEKIDGGARSRRASRAAGSRRWPRRSATACGPACSAACAPSGSRRSVSRLPRSKPSPRRSTVARPRGCRPSALLGAGENVALRAGALRDGWEASLARTYVVGDPSVEQPPPDGWDELVGLCRAGHDASGTSAISRPSCTASAAASSPTTTTSSSSRRMVFALELHRRRGACTKTSLHLTDSGAVILTADE